MQWMIGAGVDLERAHDRTRSAGVDSVVNVPSAGAPSGSSIPPAVDWTGDSKTTGLFGETTLSFANAGSLRVSVRDEASSILASQSATTVYPSISGTFNLLHALPALADSHTLNAATAHAGLTRSGSELTPYAVQTLYSGRLLSGAVTPLATSALAVSTNLEPEVTTTAELGADVALASRRLTAGFTLYSARTTGVILPIANSTAGTIRATNAAEVSNSGVEAEAGLHLGDGDRGLGWELSGNVARNSNRVEHLLDTLSRVQLGPTLYGASIEARPGAPLGVIVGTRYLRDPASGALVLSAGLPVPDLEHGAQQLGVAAPDWLVGLHSSLRYGWVSVDVSMDGHLGGSVFSATKLWGDFAGNLAETAFRPDSGLLIEGIDAVTRRANTQHVSTQDYYHALAAIQEPWVYSASYLKMRDARLTLRVPTSFWRFPFESATVSLIGRNLYTWASQRDFDPESILSPYRFNGIELGQLPLTKSFGIQFSLVP
jgi:hypothetical protein